MRRRTIAILGKIAQQRLEERRRAVETQAGAVAAVEGAILRLDADGRAQREAALEDDRSTLALIDWIDEETSRHALLRADRETAEAELGTLVDAARDAYVEVRRYDRIVALIDERARDVASRRETRRLDEIGGRRRIDRS